MVHKSYALEIKTEPKSKSTILLIYPYLSARTVIIKKNSDLDCLFQVVKSLIHFDKANQLKNFCLFTSKRRSFMLKPFKNRLNFSKVQLTQSWIDRNQV